MSTLDFTLMARFKDHEYDIRKQIAVWAYAFKVDNEAIERQVGFAYAWYVANPKKFPKKYVNRALNSWMKNAYRYGNLVKKRENYIEKPVEEDMSLEELQAIRERNFPRRP